MLWGAMGLTLPHCTPQEQASWVCRCEASWGSVGLGLYGPVGSIGGAMGLTLPHWCSTVAGSWLCSCKAGCGSGGSMGLWALWGLLWG